MCEKRSFLLNRIHVPIFNLVFDTPHFYKQQLYDIVLYKFTRLSYVWGIARIQSKTVNTTLQGCEEFVTCFYKV